MKVTSFLSLDQLVLVDVSRTGGQSSGGGGAPTETPTVSSADVYMSIEKLSGSQIHRHFGAKSMSEWRAFADSDLDIVEHDFVTVKSGQYAGEILEVDLIRTPANEIKVLALKEPNRKTS